MYQIPGPSISVRLNEEDRNNVNEFLQAIQNSENIQYSHAKDMFLDVIDRLQNTKDSVNTNNPFENEHVLSLLEIYRENNDLPRDTDVTQLLMSALTQVNEPLPEAPTVEVIKEVEKEIGENEVLIQFTPEQKSVIDKITSNRNEKLPEDKQETPSLMIKKMVLNKSNVYNWHGNFYTGFNKIF